MKRVIIAAAFLMALAWPAGVSAHTPSWNLTGGYTIVFTCTEGCVGEAYTHSTTITSSNETTGAVVGTGFVEDYSGVDYTVTGMVSGSGVTLDIEWSSTSGLQATNPLLLTGTIDSSGGMSGTASDAGLRTFTWVTTAGAATPITPRTLTVTGITAANKTYDGTTAATLNTTSAALVGVIGGDTVTLIKASATGTFDTKSPGTGKTVTVSGLTIGGADAGNYNLTQPTTTANITAKALTVTGITAANKTYDGTTAATLNTTSAALVGVIGGDTVTLIKASATGTFDTKSPGTGKTVTVSGLTIGGADAGNYNLTQPTTTANITANVSGATYHAITPARLLDTRSGNGLSGEILANTPATFQVTGRGGIPANAIAVTGNVTVANATSSWALYLGPDPVAHPATSTINFTAGQVTGNGLTVALSNTGSLSATYMSTSGNTTHLIFDVTGYFTPDASGATYHPMMSSRLLDTRVGNGLSSKLVANTPATLQVAGRGGVPANATAVTGNLTVVNPSFSWAVYLGPDPVASPTTSTLNFNAGEVKGNSLTVALSGTGTLSATYMSTAGNSTDLVFDVTGFYTADLTGATFVPITPARLLDTRSGNGLPAKLSANTPATFGVTGRSGVPANATGVTGNVTVVNETNGWAVFLGPTPTPAPTTSTINFNKGDVKGNGLTVALSGTGALSATYMSTGGNTTDLVFDATGYFAP